MGRIHKTSWTVFWTFFIHQSWSTLLQAQTNYYSFQLSPWIWFFLSTRIIGLNGTNLLNCPLRLVDDIQRELYLLQPQTLDEAIVMAWLVEDKCNTTHVAFIAFQQGILQTSSMPPPLFPGSRCSTTLPIKQLTPTEMAIEREEGLCWNYDSRFIPSHQCTLPKFLCLLADTPDTGEPPDSGPLSSLTVIVLIDGGSTNNFVQSHLVKHLGLIVKPSPHHRVIVDNGYAMSCTVECSQVSSNLVMLTSLLISTYYQFMMQILF